ncbi:FAD-binding oxidoreductase [uncultured Roseobacter sp.]|uniref:FAD-binding oxidoreductase n=1 Tax=uncultured Roseobacter sp. TaxID=114847 RepID=UPI00262ACA89|nr:FAD-binding oxidoreductase [uncultured Roseobacter sp.]
MLSTCHVHDGPLSGWGRYPVLPCMQHDPVTVEDMVRAIESAPVIARGAGRAYGDSALQTQGVIRTKQMGRAVSLDAASGVLEAEAGASFADVLAVAVPQGWFVPVTPGTKFVTLGGAAAADVHGKNHHAAGAFGDHVLWLELMGADGNLRRCSPTEDAACFQATLGGMGLTGIIRRLALQMIPVETAWMRQETVMAPDLEAAFAAFEASQDWTYTVAWIDALAGGAAQGRTVLFRGEHARLDDLPAARRAHPLEAPARRRLSIPVNAPNLLLNRWSARAFNMAYWRAQRGKTETQLVDYDSYFYPLDAVLHWNRLYGRRGFVQYQCVLPLAASLRGLRQMLDAIRASGEGAFLAVLKLMGAQSRTGLSFPMQGYTLALDFPMTKTLPRLLHRLDAIVTAYQGRIYLAKDARMSAETFRRGYDDLENFEALRRDIGAAGVFKSHQSERLGLS